MATHSAGSFGTFRAAGGAANGGETGATGDGATDDGAPCEVLGRGGFASSAAAPQAVSARPRNERSAFDAKRRTARPYAIALVACRVLAGAIGSRRLGPGTERFSLPCRELRLRPPRVTRRRGRAGRTCRRPRGRAGACGPLALADAGAAGRRRPLGPAHRSEEPASIHEDAGTQDVRASRSRSIPGEGLRQMHARMSSRSPRSCPSGWWRQHATPATVIPICAVPGCDAVYSAPSSTHMQALADEPQQRPVGDPNPRAAPCQNSAGTSMRCASK